LQLFLVNKINLLAWIKHIGGFPLNNESVQGMLRDSEFMEVRNKSPSWASRALQINGALGLNFLARCDGDTFGEIPDVGKYLKFPKADHVGILTNSEVIRCMLGFLNQHTTLED